MYTKFDDCSFSCSSKMIGLAKILMEHATLTTPLLGLISHP